MPTFQFTKKRFLTAILCALVILATAGWFFTDFLVRMATRTVKADVDDANLIISLHLINELKRVEGAAVAVAGSPLTLPVLQANTPENMQKINNILDRYHKSLDAAACYLIDRNGVTLASSNRDAKDSFVGQNYTFRPYFQKAIQGGNGRYFAFGTVSKRRGFYAAAPVRDRKGSVVGVVAIKKELDDVEEKLSQYIWFLADRNGIVFLSSQPQARLKSLWPLDDATREAIIQSKQFGPGPFDPLLPKKTKSEIEVTFNGEQYLASKQATPYEGIFVMLLWPSKQITTYRAFGLILTALSVLLTLSFITIIFIFQRSNARAKQLLEESRSQTQALAESGKLLQSQKSELESQKEALLDQRQELEQSRERLVQTEERSRLILSSIREGIWGLDKEGRTIFVNRAAAEMLGYTEESLIGQPMHALVHHSRPDGSAYPKEECPMYRTFVDGKSYTVSDEVLWRKDGSRFPVEYNTTPIHRNGELVGSVVTYHDITERRAAEQAIQAMAQRYHAILSIQHNGILVVTEEGEVEFANQSFCDQFGLAEKPADLIGLTAAGMIRRILPAYSAPGAAARIGEILAQGQPIVGEEVAMTNGRLFLRDFSPILVDGKRSGRMWQHRDITDRKRAEEELKQHMEELEQFNRLTIDREIKMIQLKEEINDCLIRMGNEARYKIVG